VKKPREELKEPSAPFWMTTFSDMVTLMLCFFVLLVSYSTIELEKFQGALESFKGALGIFSGHESPQKKQFINFDQTLSTQRMDLFERTLQLEKIMESLRISEEVEIEIRDGGILIRFGDNIFFNSGKAVLKNEAYKILSPIAKLFGGDGKEIYVEGHTDNIPIHTVRYPSNWELSYARAFSVVKYFYQKENIPEKFLAAVGHGEHRPLVPNDTKENRKINRRVEIFIKWEE